MEIELKYTGLLLVCAMLSDVYCIVGKRVITAVKEKLLMHNRLNCAPKMAPNNRIPN